MRIVFMGTPDFSVPSLQALLQSGRHVAAVYTQPPRPKNRGHHVCESPIHMLGKKEGLPVFTPRNLRAEETVLELQHLQPDLIVVAAYGCLLPKTVLDIPRLGCINVHASLLPRWRGAAPIHHALLSGDAETGTTIMLMDVGLDTGPVFSYRKTPILDSTTYEELYTTLSYLGAKHLIDVLDDDNRQSLPQSIEGVTIAPKVGKLDGILDPSQSAFLLDRQIRALNASPGTWFKDVKILKGHPLPRSSTHPLGSIVLLEKDRYALCCYESFLVLEIVQKRGGKPMTAHEWMRGVH